MKDKFKKADLKDGMVIETRTEGKYLVLGDLLIDQNGATGIDEYNDDLLIANKTVKEDEGFDIVAVYRFCNYGMYPSIKNILESEDYLELVWRRKETKRMTVEEMRQKLEELTGEKIEVEPSRFEMVIACEEYCIKQHNAFGCKQCPIHDEYSGCNFKEYSDEMLMNCYEKVMEDGKE